MAIKKNETSSIKAVVSRVHDFRNGVIAFDMIANGVSIYGCRHIEKNGKSFVSFPQYQDKDKNYWNHVYFKIDDELLSDIEKQISDML